MEKISNVAYGVKPPKVDKPQTVKKTEWQDYANAAVAQLQAEREKWLSENPDITLDWVLGKTRENPGAPRSADVSSILGEGWAAEKPYPIVVIALGEAEGRGFKKKAGWLELYKVSIQVNENVHEIATDLESWQSMAISLDNGVSENYLVVSNIDPEKDTWKFKLYAPGELKD